MIDTSKAIRFMTNNFLETGYAALDVSSSNPDYDFNDCIDPMQRSKVFKFGGRFLIQAGVNDKIYINGVTYTIPAGNYNTSFLLGQAISTAIAASHLSCSVNPFDNTFEFNKLSGAPILTLSNRVNAIWDTIGFTASVDIPVGIFTIYGDAARIHWPYEEITIDFGYSAQIGFVGIIGDLAEELKIPQGAEIKILGNNVNDFTAPPLEQVIPWYTTGAFKFIDDIVDSAWRYVKLRITCPTGAFNPEMGYLYIGDYSVFPDNRNISTGFEIGPDDKSVMSSADDGQLYTNDKTPVREFASLGLDVARPDAVAFLKNIYKLKQLSVPFFVALDPKSYLSETFDEHLAFVRFISPPRSKHIIKNLYQVGFELREAM